MPRKKHFTRHEEAPGPSNNLCAGGAFLPHKRATAVDEDWGVSKFRRMPQGVGRTPRLGQTPASNPGTNPTPPSLDGKRG